MLAMVLEKQGEPLQIQQLPVPKPGPGQILIHVAACGVCRTDLHIVDGDLSGPKLPLIPGHEIVGRVVKNGEGVKGFIPGDRVGVPWLGKTCGSCPYCRRGQENLCDSPLFTGYTINGGYAEYVVAHEQYTFKLPEGYADVEAAPLLYAGLIGYRSYRMAGEVRGNLGIYGFGAAAHILVQIAVNEGKKVFAFTRPGDDRAKNLALGLGASWAGDSSQAPPERLDAAIIFAPVGELLPVALKASDKGGCVVCGGIHMSDIPSFPYDILWGERTIRSVANLTRRDAKEFFEQAEKFHIKTEVEVFPLEKANEALDRLRTGDINGAAVLDLLER
ncbi:MAG: zinc-dependent alcohol dehydrogenase family protein [Proteobacteria bacterium]|nr:zinc-dependent alcohol dehydrogenase family protein [Pseudomonadota bacterium]